MKWKWDRHMEGLYMHKHKHRQQPCKLQMKQIVNFHPVRFLCPSSRVHNPSFARILTCFTLSPCTVFSDASAQEKLSERDTEKIATFDKRCMSDDVTWVSRCRWRRSRCTSRISTLYVYVCFSRLVINWLLSLSLSLFISLSCFHLRTFVMFATATDLSFSRPVRAFHFLLLTRSLYPVVVVAAAAVFFVSFFTLKRRHSKVNSEWLREQLMSRANNLV